MPEYWRFDPEGGCYYGQPIIGERLVDDGRYEPFPLLDYDAGAVGSTSPLLNLDFRWDGQRFRVHDPTTGAEHEHWQQTRTRLAADNANLAADNARLLAEVQRLRGAAGDARE